MQKKGAAQIVLIVSLVIAGLLAFGFFSFGIADLLKRMNFLSWGLVIVGLVFLWKNLPWLRAFFKI